MADRPCRHRWRFLVREGLIQLPDGNWGLKDSFYCTRCLDVTTRMTVTPNEPIQAKVETITDQTE